MNAHETMNRRGIRVGQASRLPGERASASRLRRWLHVLERQPPAWRVRAFVCAAPVREEPQNRRWALPWVRSPAFSRNDDVDKVSNHGWTRINTDKERICTEVNSIHHSVNGLQLLMLCPSLFVIRVHPCLSVFNALETS